MKTYEIAIDVESFNVTVNAETEEQAKEIALERFNNYKAEYDLDYWIGDCYEAKE